MHCDSACLLGTVTNLECTADKAAGLMTTKTGRDYFSFSGTITQGQVPLECGKRRSAVSIVPGSAPAMGRHACGQACSSGRKGFGGQQKLKRSRRATTLRSEI